jgi:hypothetical protein
MRFVYDNPRQVLGEYNPVEYIAQISPTPLLLPAWNDALAPAVFAIAAHKKALEPKRPEISPGGHFDTYVQRLRRLKPPSSARDAVRADHIGGCLRGHAKAQVALRDEFPLQPASSAGVHGSRLTAWRGQSPCRSPQRSTLSAAPIRATIVKRAHEPGPVTTRAAGLG